MDVTTITGVVENGQIRLPADVRLPEHSTVYVLVPKPGPTVSIASPRLVHPEQAKDFELTVTKEN